MFNQDQQLQRSPNNFKDDPNESKRPKHRGQVPYTKGTLAWELSQQCDPEHAFAVCGRDPFHSDETIMVKGKKTPSYKSVEEACKSLSCFVNHCDPQSSVLFS